MARVRRSARSNRRARETGSTCGSRWLARIGAGAARYRSRRASPDPSARSPEGIEEGIGVPAHPRRIVHPVKGGQEHQQGRQRHEDESQHESRDHHSARDAERIGETPDDALDRPPTAPGPATTTMTAAHRFLHSGASSSRIVSSDSIRFSSCPQCSRMRSSSAAVDDNPGRAGGPGPNTLPRRDVVKDDPQGGDDDEEDDSGHCQRPCKGDIHCDLRVCVR